MEMVPSNPEVDEFDAYVNKGYYSAWYKDNLKSIGKKLTDKKSAAIRTFRVSQFKELEDVYIRRDGTIEDVPRELIKNINIIINGEFIRLMVSNHDVYVEFSAIPSKFIFVKNRLQYDEYKDKYDNKLYHQTAEVNYATYKPGFWYLSFKDVLNSLSKENI